MHNTLSTYEEIVLLVRGNITESRIIPDSGRRAFTVERQQGVVGTVQKQSSQHVKLFGPNP